MITHTAHAKHSRAQNRVTMINTLIRSSLIAACTFAAISSCDTSSQSDAMTITDEYVTILITQRDESRNTNHITDVISINIDDSRVARSIFAVSDESANVITINEHTVEITRSDLYSVCDALDATGIECFS